MARAGFPAHFLAAGFGFRVVECAFHAALAGLAGGWMGSPDFVGAQPGAVLQPGRQIQFSVSGLRDYAAGAAAVRVSPLPELVSAQDAQAGGMEGADVWAVKEAGN